MTTIACNLREIAADTRVTWEGVGTDTYRSIKLYSGPKAIYAITGENCDGSLTAVDWLRGGALPLEKPVPPNENEWDWKIAELSSEGIAIYNTMAEREVCIEPFLAFGSGRKVAYYCMKYLGMSPPEAVREACRVDHWSELPIYHATLPSRKVKLWEPPKSKSKELPVKRTKS